MKMMMAVVKKIERKEERDKREKEMREPDYVYYKIKLAFGVSCFTPQTLTIRHYKLISSASKV